MHATLSEAFLKTYKTRGAPSSTVGTWTTFTCNKKTLEYVFRFV